MLVKKISLTNYKNLSSKDFTFNSSINCFVGNNGKGKSNILDSIYHLAFGKSFFNATTIQNIMFNKLFFLIEGQFEINSRKEKITCSYKKGKKKVLKRNNIIYDKFSDHIGLIPLVLISPDDIDLISEGSNLRRKFIDGILGQVFPEYLRNLIDYNKILAQRNSLLKYFASNQTFDSKTIEIYNLQLKELGIPIYKHRSDFIKNFSPLFLKRYQAISDEKEKGSLLEQTYNGEKPLKIKGELRTFVENGDTVSLSGYAEKNGVDTVIVDTAGRLHVDEKLMLELKEREHYTKPSVKKRLARAKSKIRHKKSLKS